MEEKARAGRCAPHCRATLHLNPMEIDWMQDLIELETHSHDLIRLPLSLCGHTHTHRLRERLCGG